MSSEPQWLDVTTFGSNYEEQTDRHGNWRHREMRRDLGGFNCAGEYKWPPDAPWKDGRAPRPTFFSVDIGEIQS